MLKATLLVLFPTMCLECEKTKNIYIQCNVPLASNVASRGLFRHMPAH